MILHAFDSERIWKRSSLCRHHPETMTCYNILFLLNKGSGVAFPTIRIYIKISQFSIKEGIRIGLWFSHTRTTHCDCVSPKTTRTRSRTSYSLLVLMCKSSSSKTKFWILLISNLYFQLQLNLLIDLSAK